ncbi:Pre-mRNA cleavage complex II protein Clp1 [Nosema bombycis CQ1]|uniref:Polynucleotide 5'-hydroxyl-kinase GRC3 n=1 Tax=Nosema bombycis (strain CQ1 / CVCC 102059) TaxID=578461 RepID=R0KSZ3_NOSB1|nr:Pre-mRNA cleavage complex II protein Clp1 [Nosema bombycis CQ1]|eukprot:EOB13881.1 Pre-mRNA cleavage complex II protein Clp1 [Nosema bombycis CQ1]
MEIVLKENEEYRIEVEETQKYKIMLIEGLAEIKGQELLQSKWYVFKDIKTFIFTFKGCRLKVDGNCKLAYISQNSNVPQIFAFFHFFVSNNFNFQNNKNFLVIGKGRTSFCTTIINYFVRLHKKVLFTELDLKKGNIFPGSLSSICIDSLIDYVQHIKLNNLLSFYYGSYEINNEDLWDIQIDRLVNAIDKKGLDAPHFILGHDTDNKSYKTIIDKFKVDKVIVIGDERMYNVIEVSIPKLYFINTGYTYENTISKSILRYFNGGDNEYTPYSFTVKYKWMIIKIGEEHLAPESALPLGSTRKLGTLLPHETELEEHAILGISEAKNLDDIINLPVVGYVVVVNQANFKILCTQSKLPKYSFLIQSDLKCLDL